jgi:sugar phosphate permease
VNPFEGTRPRLRTVLLAVAAMTLVAVTLFRVPLATIFTLGVLLVCPLMMIGMHGGGHGADHSPADEAQTDPTDRKVDANDHRLGEQS